MTKSNSQKTKTSVRNDEKMQSFLDETQKAGKATGKIELKNLDEALDEVPKILNEDIAEFYKKTPEEDWPTCTMAIYSHDAHDIVPAGIGKTVRGKERIVCGVTGSKKIARGREEALRRFYHVDEKKKSQEKNPSSSDTEKISGKNTKEDEKKRHKKFRPRKPFKKSN